MLDGGEYSPCSESSEPFSCINTLTATGKKKRNKNKRRFNNDQIKLLETMFESESRPEPRKKVQLARDLGLQPRQVAIWFQNKRARWKSKQIEQDYSILRSNYNSLASRFEILKKEKQALVVQLQKLNDMVQKSQDESQSGREVLDNKTRSELCNGETARSESEVKTTSSVEVSEHGLGVLSDDDISMKAEYFGLEEEPPLLNMVEPANSPLTSQEDWSRLETDGLFEQSSNTYQWLSVVGRNLGATLKALDDVNVNFEDDKEYIISINCEAANTDPTLADSHNMHFQSYYQLPKELKGDIRKLQRARTVS